MERNVTLKTVEKKKKEYMEYLLMQEKAKNTVRAYSRHIDTFVRYIRDERKLEALGKIELVEFKQWMLPRYSPSTINLVVSSLNGLFAFMGMESMKLKKLKQQRSNSLENVLTMDEYKKLLTAAKMRNEKMYCIIRTLAGMGIRVGELKYITVDAVKHGEARIINKGKIRNVVLKENIRRMLEAYCEANGIIGGVIFEGRNGREVISRAYICAAMKELGTKAGIPREKLFAHNLRHLFAKRFIEKTNDIVTLADVLGHTSIDTTRIYTRTSNAEKRAKIETVDL
ncbi:tyrosine-type recombinase/integrase [Christensenella intestinihominis]|uniref:tyrosine-type recombinase/integrase n=1 Tax=Christensenella intestinihominis TaxID=1851429 RepID=UPI00082BF0C0|nr:tyrosine-type recombinase/integrase [Christensenella intestinihominis]